MSTESGEVHPVGTIVVTGGSPVDSQNPVVVAGSGVVQQGTVAVGQSITFTFRATDDIGVTSAGGIIYNGSQLVNQGGSATRVSGTASDGVWSVTLSIPDANSAGTYTISGYVQDALSKGSGYVPVGTIVVTGGSPVDSQNPVVVAGSGVVQQGTVAVGQSITFTFRATDDIGVTSAGGIIYNGSQLVNQGGSATRVSGTASDGVWSVTLSIPDANSAGTYTISGYVQDALSKGSGYVPVGTIVVTD